MPTFAPGIAQTAAIVVCLAFAFFAALMAFWACGKTWGLSNHWGGRYEELPVGLRVADAAGFFFYLAGIWVAISRAWSLDAIAGEGFLTAFAWVSVALMLGSALANFASPQPVERSVFGPIALVSALLWIVIARGEWVAG